MMFVSYSDHSAFPEFFVIAIPTQNRHHLAISQFLFADVDPIYQSDRYPSSAASEVANI
jgi:hypothetical protein